MLLGMAPGATVTCEMSYASRVEHDRFPETYVLVEGEQGSVELGPDYWIRVTTRGGHASRRCPPPRYAWADPRYELAQSSGVACNANLLAQLCGRAPGGDHRRGQPEDAAAGLRLLRVSPHGRGRAAGLTPRSGTRDHDDHCSLRRRRQDGLPRDRPSEGQARVRAALRRDSAAPGRPTLLGADSPACRRTKRCRGADVVILALPDRVLGRVAHEVGAEGHARAPSSSRSTLPRCAPASCRGGPTSPTSSRTPATRVSSSRRTIPRPAPTSSAARRRGCRSSAR